MTRLERTYQGQLIQRLREIVEPEGLVIKTDPNYIQGFPDILVLYKNRWASLECKRSHDEPFRPNQEYYIAALDRLSFASVVYPEIEDEVINDLQHALRIRGRGSRISKP